MLTENIRSLGKVKLSKQGLEKIRDNFSAMLKEEIRSRKQMEAFIQDHYGPNDTDSYKHHIVHLQNRDEFGEDAFQCKYCTDLCYWSMIKCSEHTIEKTEINQGADEAKKLVGRCMMSKQEKRQQALKEAQGSAQYCVHHLNYCGCAVPKYTMVYRYTTQELNQMLDDINLFIREFGATKKTAGALTAQPRLVPKLKPLSMVFSQQNTLVNP